MKKKFVIGAIAVLISVGSANAIEWGNVANTLLNRQTTAKQTTAESSAELTNMLNSLVSQSQAVDTSVQNSFLSLVSQLSDEDDVSGIQSAINSIYSNTSTSANEKGQLLSNILSSYTDSLKSNKTDTANKITNMSAVEKALLIKNVTNMAQSGQQYTNIAKQAISTAKTAAKTAQNANDIINTITTINQTATNIKNRATSVINMVNQIKTISQLAGVSI